MIPEDINQISAFAKEEIQNLLADDIKSCYTTNYDDAWAAIDTRDEARTDYESSDLDLADATAKLANITTYWTNYYDPIAYRTERSEYLITVQEELRGVEAELGEDGLSESKTEELEKQKSALGDEVADLTALIRKLSVPSIVEDDVVEICDSLPTL